MKCFSGRWGSVSADLVHVYNSTCHVRANICAFNTVFPRINIKGGGVHLWYMMFGQQCSISIVKHYFSV